MSINGVTIPFIAPENVVLYPEDDKTTEDIFLIDKAESDRYGLTPILSAIKAGQMRYGENVFDQQSSLIQDGILHADLPREEKERLMGIHVLAELETHTHNHNMHFATSGKTKKAAPKPASRYTMAGNQLAEFIQSREFYNQWAQRKGLPTLPAGSTFNDSAAVAFANFNADPTNLRKLKVSTNNFLNPSTGDTQLMATKFELGKFMPEIKELPNSAISGYNTKGEYVYGDQLSPNMRDPKTNRLLVVNKDYQPTAVDTAVKPKSVTTTKVDGVEARKKAFRNESLVSNLVSLAGAAAGGLMAATDIPRYQPTAEYTNLLQDVIDRKDQGLSAEETASLNQGLQQNYANGIESIRTLAGGGSTQGSVLGALQGLSSNLDRGILDIGLADVNARRQNQQTYRNAVLSDLDIDRQIFNEDRANAMDIRQNGLAMVQQGVQGLYDRSLYNQSYGPGTIYDSLLQSQLQGADEYKKLAELQTQLALENIQRNAAPPVTSYGATTRPVSTLPNITVPKF